jgi:hypothetical protein
VIVIAAAAGLAALGGLIPIVGLGGIGYLIVRAARDHDEGDD